jgi:hypothetical protein
MTFSNAVMPTRAQLDTFRRPSGRGRHARCRGLRRRQAGLERGVRSSTGPGRPTSNVETSSPPFGRERHLSCPRRRSQRGRALPTDGGLVIDLGRMNAVGVDPAQLAPAAGPARPARIAAGARARLPGRVVGHTGVAGLTLGGGVGRLQRRFGLTIDSLRAVELVTADGRLCAQAPTRAGPVLGPPRRGRELRRRDEPGARATSVLRDPPPRVHIHPATDIHELWATFREFAAAAPDTIAAIFTVALADPAGDYPEAVAGRPIVVISYNHSGAGEDVERTSRRCSAGLRRCRRPPRASRT